MLSGKFRRIFKQSFPLYFPLKVLDPLDIESHVQILGAVGRCESWKNWL